MSVYITNGGTILAVPTEDDLAPAQLCANDCQACLIWGTNDCPVRMRQFELLADGWMLQRVHIGTH